MKYYGWLMVIIGIIGGVGNMYMALSIELKRVVGFNAWNTMPITLPCVDTIEIAELNITLHGNWLIISFALIGFFWITIAVLGYILLNKGRS